MERPALVIIHDEHQALSAMLRSLSMMMRRSLWPGETPDFSVLRAMLLYVDEFPERLHHSKESALLFPKVRQRCPALGPVLDRLEQDHARGERAIRQVQHALLAYEVLGEPRRAAFEEALAGYTRFYLEHMAVEEQHILPAAREHLDEADWAELDAAFLQNRDPLTGHAAANDYQPLFHKILNEAPAPIGLGRSG